GVWTGRSLIEFLQDFVVHAVEGGIGLPDVDPGEHEGGHDHEEADRHADGGDAVADRGSEEVGRIGDEQDEAEVDDEHGGGEYGGKPRAPFHQRLEFRVLLDAVIGIFGHA